MSGKGMKGQAQGYGHAPKGQTPGYGNAPKALRNKAKYRRRCHSAPNFRVYGPPKRQDRFWMDLKMLKLRCPELAGDVEKRKKENDDDDKKVRIPEKEAEKLPQLTVKNINFHVQGKRGADGKPDVPGNCRMHHTDLFTCCKGDNPRPVFRRGQEFKATIAFDRPYNLAQDDLILLVEADENSHGKSLSDNFKLDEERSKRFTEGMHWAARIVKKLPEKNALKLVIYIPGNCPVGEWDIKVKTRLRDQEMTCIYEHPVSFVVLFNPWSDQDQVCYTGDMEDLEEYILNDKGIVYFGTGWKIFEKTWRYGQFEEDVLEVCLGILRMAFDMKMTSAMSNAVTVTRALSKIVNSIGDNGVLEGNWTGNYTGGTCPTKWMSSDKILKQFSDKGAPIKYGQCWVFSHVLTAVCRALGIPCRSVTNFDSAHDTDGSCSIDSYFRKDGTEDSSMKTDSVWNFHVWNEVWIQRPDIEEVDCNGWHVVDATPQEQSEGYFQCGPCPVAAVKRGLIYLGFDTAFVFSEVNADIAHWMLDDDGGWKCTAVKKRDIGHCISTKRPNKDERMDLTSEYKFPEGSEEERQAVRRAVRLSPKGQDMYVQSADIELSIDETSELRTGSDLTVMIVVKNVSNAKKTVELVTSARSCSYWNDADTAKELCQASKPSFVIGAGQTEKVPFTVTSKQYMDKDRYTRCLYIYARCMDTENKMPYSVQKPFEFSSPELVLKEKSVKSKAGQVVTATATFNNPLDIPLTGCETLMEGDLLPGGEDKNKFKHFYGMYCRSLEDVKPKAQVIQKFHLFWEEEKEDKDDDEDSDDGECGGAGAPPPTARAPKKASKSERLEFYSNELDSMSTTFTIECVRA